jgi:hypothetical protein
MYDDKLLPVILGSTLLFLSFSFSFARLHLRSIRDLYTLDLDFKTVLYVSPFVNISIRQLASVQEC